MRLAQRSHGAGAQVHLQLEAGDTVPLRADYEATRGDAWACLTPANEPIELSGEWSVEFIDGGPRLPASYRTKGLASWTDGADTSTRAFTGTGRYTLRFKAPATSADQWLLDLGVVRESACVGVNGRDAGTLIAIRFRTRVGAILTPGKNTLEIEVTNFSANRIRDPNLRKVDGRSWKTQTS